MTPAEKHRDSVQEALENLHVNFLASDMASASPAEKAAFSKGFWKGVYAISIDFLAKLVPFMRPPRRRVRCLRGFSLVDPRGLLPLLEAGRLL